MSQGSWVQTPLGAILHPLLNAQLPLPHSLRLSLQPHELISLCLHVHKYHQDVPVRSLLGEAGYFICFPEMMHWLGLHLLESCGM